MLTSIVPPVSLRWNDHARLEALAGVAWSDQHPVAGFLLAEIRRAQILEEFPQDEELVTLESWVTFRVDRGPSESRLLVMPEDYASPKRHVSVLSPLGAALIGVKVGDQMPYLTIEGVFHLVKVLGVTSAPKIAMFKPLSPRKRLRIDDDDPWDPGPRAA